MAHTHLARGGAPPLLLLASNATSSSVTSATAAARCRCGVVEPADSSYEVRARPDSTDDQVERGGHAATDAACAKLGAALGTWRALAKGVCWGFVVNVILCVGHLGRGGGGGRVVLYGVW